MTEETQIETKPKPVFSVRFALFIALLSSAILPAVLVLLLPIVDFITRLFGWSFLPEEGLAAAGSFSLILISTQALSVLITVYILWRFLKKRGLSLAVLGLRSVSVKTIFKHVFGYYLVLFILFLAVVFIAVQIGWEPEEVEEPVSVESYLFIGGFLANFLLAVIIAPIGEELVFRGVLFKALKDKWGVTAGVILSAIIFSLVHIDINQMLSTLPLGIYMAISYHRSCSIYPAIILHATWNLIVTLIASNYLAGL